MGKSHYLLTAFLWRWWWWWWCGSRRTFADSIFYLVNFLLFSSICPDQTPEDRPDAMDLFQSKQWNWESDFIMVACRFPFPSGLNWQMPPAIDRQMKVPKQSANPLISAKVKHLGSEGQLHQVLQQIITSWTTIQFIPAQNSQIVQKGSDFYNKYQQ